MGIRYDIRDIRLNNDERYENVFKKRGVNYINQYTTPIFRQPSSEEIKELELVGKIWNTGDRFWKLAEKYYGDPELWWIIAQFNETPTENHIELGSTIYVPLPLEKILQFLGY